MMLQTLSDQISGCMDHAAYARERAERATSPSIRADYLDIERRWLKLAESYRLVERTEQFLADARRKRQSQQQVRTH